LPITGDRGRIAINGDPAERGDDANLGVCREAVRAVVLKLDWGS
jgi:hypothetical protein